MLAELQPYTIGYCWQCGSKGVFNPDTERVEWEYPLDGCQCEFNPQQGGCDEQFTSPTA